MKWVWENENWPTYLYKKEQYLLTEQLFIKQTGKFSGILVHLLKQDEDIFKTEIFSNEAYYTSKIEGEILNRDSVRSSIKKHLGFKTDGKKIDASAYGIGEMMVDIFNNYSRPLSHSMLYAWHSMLMNGRRDIEVIGAYRKHKEPMQIVSGNYSNPTLYYEAPPSNKVKTLMNKFVIWFNAEAKKTTTEVLSFAAKAHLYFEQIHPFEDGNGRIGRAIIEKALAIKLQHPSMIAISTIIEKNKKKYYAELKNTNHNLNITNWLNFFIPLLIDAQTYSLNTIAFVVKKNKLFSKYQHLLNLRQVKVLLRVYEEGIEGFLGGLSASNYQRIANTSTATTTRDLTELVSLNIFSKKGSLKSTRYYLNDIL